MNLISKKDLLAITGISYGQLYRWKRERLIPEEWFIKQSAYTGQETFFPREQILSRIKSILDLKDLYSLEELAKLLSPEASVAMISISDLKEVSEIPSHLLNAMTEIFDKDRYEFFEVAFMIAISQTSVKLRMNREQTEQLLRRSLSAANGQKDINTTCTVFLAAGEYHTVFTSNTAPLVFDEEIELKDQIHLSEIADTIKMKYKNLFVK